MAKLAIVIGVLALTLASTADVDNATCELTKHCEPLELDHRLSASRSGKTLWQLATLQKTANRTSNVTTTFIGNKESTPSDLELKETSLHGSIVGGGGKGVEHNETFEHGKRAWN